MDAIHTNERVLALSTNPLLCTIIAVVFRNNRVLPDRRVELYFKCCEALLDTWERNKDIRNSGLIGNFGLQQKLELLATLAHWMHSKAERLAAPEEEIVRRIAEALKADHQSDPGRAECEARRFIEAIRDRSGLLRGRGDGSLEFSHRTFQEYLAARHIAALDEEPMIDAAMAALKDDNQGVRGAAAQALGGAAAGDPAVTAALLAALKDDNQNVLAAEALSRAPSADRKLFRKTLAALFQNFERTGFFFRRDSQIDGEPAAARLSVALAARSPETQGAPLQATEGDRHGPCHWRCAVFRRTILYRPS